MMKTKIGMVPLVVQCGHCPGPEVIWVEKDAGEAPEFCYRGFPEAGRIAMSKDTIVLACKSCAKDIPSLIREFQNVL